MIDREPATPYEAWVVTLRVWADDPSTPLDGLPTLTEESLPRDAYSRLFEHLFKAMERSGDHWQTGLTEALSQYRDFHDLADRLVKLRMLLARRLQLASHPGLPEQVRTALTEDFTRMVERNQTELHDQLRRELARNQAPQAMAEQLMRTIQENSFTGVMNVTIHQDGARASVEPLPDLSDSAPADAPRRRRSIVSD